MRTILAMALALALPWAAWAQTADPTPTPESTVSIAADTGTVTLTAKGTDVRDVLFDLFDQTKKNFVLEPNVRFVLYLSLQGIEFEEALDIVCEQASLKYEVDNGIYYVSRRAAPAAGAKTGPEVAVHRPVRVTETDLQKRLTTRLKKADLRAVFAEFAKQTGVAIEVSPRVPRYKLDAFLNDTSLRYALDVTTRAAKLTWTPTDSRSILIDVAAPRGSTP